ncbi:hypothetical protein DSM112329_00940 [Paraconexibacter sp. AEG42_29]|uniref:AzlD domain-containing protein n=1 Tax=Paraconexibacter sp. AEG42_29 TaxID=2997339 RepID=A0AAU7AR42_9ACTN
MTWGAILGLALVSYLFKAVGPVLIGARPIPDGTRALLDLAAVPLLAALILVQTVSTDGSYSVDARLPALGVAALLIWRRAPFLVVILAAAATAATLRLV